LQECACLATCVSICPDVLFLNGFEPRDLDDETRDKPAQIEPAMKPIAEGGEVRCVLAVVQGVTSAGQGEVEVAEYGVDCARSRDLSARTTTGRCAQPASVTAAKQPRPSLRTVVHIPPLASVIDRASGHERHLVLGAASGIAGGALATAVGIVELHNAAELMGAVRPGHGEVELWMHKPSVGVAHSHLVLEGQRRQPGLGLANNVDREEPDAQRQLRVLHQLRHSAQPSRSAGTEIR